MHKRRYELRRILTESPADQLVERLSKALATHCQIAETTLFQVDYRLAALLPLFGGEPVVAPGHPAWRCFDHQTPITHNGVLYLPVTTRGARIGVLRLAPTPPDSDTFDEVVEIATVLAHELAAAGDGTDRYTVAARTRRMTLAAEMQWALLPARSRTRPTFDLAGQLEPAYAVRGDSFDWSDDGDRLWLAVINGMGEGVAAATLTTLVVNALRNARRAGLPLADQVTLADEAVYACYRGQQYVSALVVELDLTTGVATAVDAGSPRLVVLRDGEVFSQRLADQFPLGMFDGIHYLAEQFVLRPGDRLFVLSDGVVDATSGQIRYGATPLERFLRRTGPMAPLEAVRSLLGDLRAFVAGDLVDDAVVVCLDWTGPRD